MSQALRCLVWRLPGAFVCLLLLAPAYAQIVEAGGASSANGPTPKFSLSGTVVNSVTGEPVRRALVQIYGPEQAVLTDSDGKFEFSNPPPGQTSIAARKPGFMSEQEMPGGGPPSMVETGPDAKPVTVKLTPEGVLFGRVDSKGEPIEDLPVKVIALRIDQGRKLWEQRGGAMTDEDGAWRIANLTPGTYYIAAGPSFRRNRFGPRSKSVPDGYAEAFYPIASDISGSVPIEVAAGQQVEADFSLKLSPVFRISGVVTGMEPGQGVGMELVNDSDVTSMGMRFGAATGEFETMATGGSYKLQAWSRGPEGETFKASAPLNVTSDVSGIRLALAPSTSIPVHVKLEKLAPENPDNGRFRFGKFDNSAPVEVRLIADELSFRNHDVGLSRTQMPGSAPELSMRDIEPGKYSAEFDPNFPWYVYSAQGGAINLLTEDLQVGSGMRLEPIEIVLRDDAAMLSAKVSSEGQPSRGTVLVIPDGAPRRAKTEFVTEGAETQMSGLAPGAYSVIALDHVDGLEYTNSEVIGPYLSNAQHVVLQPNQKLELTLELTRVRE